MGMGKLNSDDHYIYYCGQESFRRNGSQQKTNSQQKILKCSTSVQSQIWQNELGIVSKSNYSILQ